MKIPKKVQAAITEKKLKQRASLWPQLDEEKLWIKENSDGWLPVPRAMPLILRIMDSLSVGKPISSTYFDLWCRTFNDSFVDCNKIREMAYYSGFSKERAERTWETRMTILKELGFIDIAEGGNGKFSYAIIFNPYLVIFDQFKKGKVSAEDFNALKMRMVELGTQELDILNGNNNS